MGAKGKNKGLTCTKPGQQKLCLPFLLHVHVHILSREIVVLLLLPHGARFESQKKLLPSGSYSRCQREFLGTYRTLARLWGAPSLNTVEYSRGAMAPRSGRSYHAKRVFEFLCLGLVHRPGTALGVGGQELTDLPDNTKVRRLSDTLTPVNDLRGSQGLLPEDNRGAPASFT